MVVEAYNVMAAVIPVHRLLQYSPEKRTGQIDIITTPYYHPILPLIYDSDLARICQPHDSLPPRYAYPEDAEAQVVKAVSMYKKIFGVAPTGMWPGEGSVAQPVLEVFRDERDSLDRERCERAAALTAGGSAEHHAIPVPGGQQADVAGVPRYRALRPDRFQVSVDGRRSGGRGLCTEPSRFRAAQGST